MKTISCKLDEGTFRWLAAEAKRLGRKKSEIVREALERRRNGTGRRSIHDLMQDYCGIIKGGPRDMATNRKYLEDLGHEQRNLGHRAARRLPVRRRASARLGARAV